MSRRGRRLTRTTLIALAVLAVITAGVALRERWPSPAARDSGVVDVLARDIPPDVPPVRFVDRGPSLERPFRHFSGVRTHRLPEDMGSGLAWGDCDDDGLPDLYVVNFAGPLGLTGDALAALPGNALYRNRGGGRFEEIGAGAGVGLRAYGLGAAWGDYDGDGDLDLFVTNFGPNVLYRNEGGCRFVDVTGPAGVGGGPAFSAGASWGDYDGDGDLDLYVTSYVDYVETGDAPEFSEQYGQSIPFTLNPSSYAPVPNLLYRNDGGRFTEVAAAAGVANPEGRSLSAAWADFDLDGDLDLYVANDISDNALFRNRGDGTFDDISAASLTADYRGAMGLAVSDVDRDGDLDFFVTHWLAQENALYTNHLSEMGPERMFFADVADSMGLGYPALKFVGWGTAFVDYDNDGWRDVFVVNGSTMEDRDNPDLLVPQRMQLFWSRGEDGYYDVTDAAGPGMARAWVGRGGAAADWDADGDVDLAATVNGGPLLLLENGGLPGRHWLEVDLRQEGRNRHALGALITVTSGEARQLHQVGASASYLSQEPATAHFGLGDAATVDVAVRWPDGVEEAWHDVAADRRLLLRRGDPVPGRR